MKTIQNIIFNIDLVQGTIHKAELGQGWHLEGAGGYPLVHISYFVICFRNLVCTVNLDCQLDLQKINFCTRNSEYTPSRFCGVVMRLRDPRATALIFSSGKIVVTGTKHEASAHLATRKFARIIQKLGFKASMVKSSTK